jgi:hypothetical protein
MKEITARRQAFGMSADELDRNKQLVAGVFFLALTLMNALVVLQVFPRLQGQRQDFGVFYHDAEMVRLGQAAHMHDLHTPFEALLFVPFTSLRCETAYVLWTLLNATMMTLSLAMFRKMFPEIGRLNRLLLVLSVTAFAPAVRAFMQGQDSVLLLFVTTAGLLLLARGNDVWGGAVMALGLFKFHIVIPLALVLAMRRPRMLAGFFSVAALVVAISAIMVGWDGLTGYARFVVHLENHGAGGTPVEAMPNVHGLIGEFTGKSGGWTVIAAVILVSALVLGIALRSARRREPSLRLAIAIGSVVCILVSYHVIMHDLTLLLPVILMLFSARAPSTRGQIWTDVGLLFATYTGLFYGSFLWRWLNPWWWVPVVFWIRRNYRRSQQAAAP